MIPNWSALQGTVLPGGYEIEQCLSAAHSEAVFKLRILGDRFTDAVLCVFAPEVVSSEQLDAWRDSLTLRHPNLNTPLASGTTVIDSAEMPYVASVRADETLDSVLTERALTGPEVKEILTNALAGLGYLHDSGWVHSSLAPETIVSVGNTIKLSGDSLRHISAASAGDAPIHEPRYLAPENKGANSTPAADVFCLGATVFEVLRRRRFDEKARDQIAELPHPFNGIADACLKQDPSARPSLQEIGVLLTRPVPVRVEKPVPPQASPAPAPKPVNAETTPAQTAHYMIAYDKSAQKPSATRIGSAAPPASPPAVRKPEVRGPATSLDSVWLGMPIRRWLYLAAAVFAVVALVWAFHPRPSISATTAQPATPAAVSSAPATSGSTATWPPHVAEPAPAASSATQSPEPNAVETPADKNANWRVVVYTFYREADAEKRLNALKAQHPSLQPMIFTPKGNGSPYLIALGGRMTKEEAERLRSKARASGLPRDTFIQNYSR